MSGNPGNSMRALLPTPPERGSFPLDHEGECRDMMTRYLKCMKLVKNENAPNCRLLAKEYLRCRMERGLMTPDEWSHLGLPGDTSSSVNANATTSSATTRPPSTDSSNTNDKKSH